jgi:hypothetical protein
MILDHSVERLTTEKSRITLRKYAPVPLCPPQIPQDPTRARTRDAAVESQRLTTLATKSFRILKLLHLTHMTTDCT